MNTLDRPGLELRDDLRSAAHRLAMRSLHRRRIVRRASFALMTVIVCAGGAVAAAAILDRGTLTRPTNTVTVGTVQGVTQPSQVIGGRAVEAMSVFSQAAPSGGVPALVRKALATYAQNPAAAFGDLVGEPHQLATAAGTTLYAQATSRGVACFAVSDGVSVAGTCATNFSSSAPVVAVISQTSPSDPVVVAGVASDGVTAIEADATSGSVCEARVDRNGFVCIAASTVTDTGVRTLTVTLSSGAKTTIPF